MYHKYEEGINYLFWGGVAFVLSILTALGGLPEVQKEPIELDPPDAEK